MISPEPQSHRLSVFLGLGLGVVMGIATAVVKSDVGAGLMIGVLLGVLGWSVVRRLETRVARSRPIAPVTSPVPQSGKVIKPRAIIIDDDQVVCRLVKMAMKEMGWDAQWEESGASAVERYRNEGPFDVTLVDYMMPDLNGGHTIRAIRAVDPAARFVLISGLSPEEMVEVDFDDPALVFLPKPFALAQLESALARIVPQSA